MIHHNLAYYAVLTLTLLVSCFEPPMEHNNPFDPKNPVNQQEGVGYDPYRLRAITKDNSIILTWQRIPQARDRGILGYRVYRSVGENQPFTQLGHVEDGAVVFSDAKIVDGETYSYKVIYFLDISHHIGSLDDSKPATVVALVDQDGDGARDSDDTAPLDKMVCHDRDTDGCDECTGGTVKPVDQDGPDLDGDGWCDTGDTDQDGDGHPDDQDVFPRNKAEWLDTDNDGKGDAADSDDDQDGHPDNKDALPKNNAEWLDFDSDGQGDIFDPDDDNDRFPDLVDAFPFDSREWLDLDADGVMDFQDDDHDNDGVPNHLDHFALHPRRCHDHDGDGCDECSSGTVADVAHDGLDSDGDGQCDRGDPDDDNDGVPDAQDALPTDPTERQDSDHDGQGDHTDLDDDNDGVLDSEDEAPLDRLRCRDQDGDGCDECAGGTVVDVSLDGPDQDVDGLCNAGDPDSDNDGVADVSDSAPLDRHLCHDLDNDGCDECTGGLVTSVTTDGPDTDHDGQCDAGDLDDDDDGLPDVVESNSGLWVEASTDTGTDPFDPDSDDDGLLDGLESNTLIWVDNQHIGTHPLDPDTDSDGLLDGLETNTGIWIDASSDTGTSPVDADTDADGLTDGVETNTAMKSVYSSRRKLRKLER